ncbi:MAG: SUMF1/EgtB/PvdO family nonheme iron enzyme [Chitinophagaceae bacterium]|nr:SUMF1/EgtB/PvdO family nonheme iron enzyme [Chitinophagaceae bacterium]
MLYRSASGSGITTLTNVELGIAAAQASGIYDIKAFAIEMVYIPGGPFFFGDGDYLNGGVNATVIYAGGTDVWVSPVTNPNTICRNGFNAYYCMKYELSQGGYRDFLNTLTYNQQVNHVVAAPSAAAGTAALYNLNRNHIKIKTPGISSTNTGAVFGCDADLDGIYDETTDGEYLACNFLNWPDQAAYLAWAGLMPLTEFEYEKAARGIALPVNAEYAWGTTQIFSSAIFTLTNPNQISEIVTNSSPTLGNANFANTYPNAPYAGPLRNGVFATATSTRVTSGGGFYGVMELSGNLAERVINFYTMVTYSSQNPYTDLNGSGYAFGNSANFVW